MTGRSFAGLFLVAAVVLSTSCGSISTRYNMGEGNKLYKGQKYEEAIQYYKKIVAADPTSWPANYQIAMCYLAMYHPGSTHPKDVEYADKSIVALERLLQLKAPDAETTEKVRNFYVGVLQSAGKMDKVVAYFSELLKKDPNNGMIMAQVAQIYAKKGDFQNALIWFDKRCAAEPRNKEAWYTVGVVCWERSYRNWKPPSPGQPLTSLIPDEEREMYVDKGMQALEKAVGIDPEYLEALAYIKLLWLERQKAFVSQGKNEQAIQARAKADELDPRLKELNAKRKAAKDALAAQGGAPPPTATK